MKLIVETIDMEKTKTHWPKETPFTPSVVRDQKKVRGHWAVLSAPLQPGGKPAWAYSEHDEYLRIPLFPYMLNGQGDLALAFMLQLGLTCAGNLPGKVTGLYIVTGKPVELLYDEDGDAPAGLRYWVGFAVITEET